MVLHTGSGFVSEVGSLQGTIEGGFGPVTEGERWEYGEYNRVWTTIKSAVETALTVGVQRVNSLAASSGLAPGIVRKGSER